MTDPSVPVPEITDHDIEWICGVMHLKTPDEPRREFLVARNSIDVSACPGSGKTTLIVAKLAILARKWPAKANGMCVLSHTNVARDEIQTRLGNTIIGQRLLGYPHFIGTIHGFVNRFLALPWLNSHGYPSPTIDNDVTTAYRRSSIGNGDFWKVQNYLGKKHSNFAQLRICNRDLGFDLNGKPFPSQPGTATHVIASRAIKAAARAGYFCFDEMFVWAHSLLEDSPDVGLWLQRRFPLVFFDEMQDTSDLQGRLLQAVFPRTSPHVVVQRIGDPNQAILENPDASPDDSDPFPDINPAHTLSIPNSYRFGQRIADLASPFAVTPSGSNGLRGIGPRAEICAPANCDHAIFVFPDDTTVGVLDAYGKHVLATFSEDALKRGLVTAVGSVHQDAPEITPGHDHFPKSVPHYWRGYTAQLARTVSHPRYLCQYVRAAQAAVRHGGDFSPGVEMLASGIIRLAGCIGDASHIRRRDRTHRTIVGGLEGDPEALGAYRRLVRVLLVDSVLLTKDHWSEVQVDILRIATALCNGDSEPTNADQLLSWSEDHPSPAARMAPATIVGPNVYRVCVGPRFVDIRLGSVHSVKGQTHLATLILDTFWNAPFSSKIMPWLLGERVHAESAGVQDRKRLLQTYVAMTRPTHMVCFALRRSAFGNDATFAQRAATLQERGWCVAEIVQGSAVWRTATPER